MRLKAYLLLFLFIFAIVNSFAQNQFYIQGEIINQETGSPVEGVNISIQNTSTGTSSDFNGNFKLKVDRFPALLELTHIAYFGKQILVKHNDVDSLVVSLVPRMVTLEETEIIAESQKVFEGKNQEIIDYDFLDQNLIILSHNIKKKLFELILTDESLDTIHIQEMTQLNKPKQLYRDCTGTCHILTSDSVYQIHWDSQKIKLHYPVNADRFFEILGDCLFMTKTHIAIEKKANDIPDKNYAAKNSNDLSESGSEIDKWNQKFYLIDKSTHQTIVIDHLNEWEKKRDAFDHALFVSAYSHRYFGDILRFAEMVYYKPAFLTLKLLNDSMYYFNHLESRIDIYDGNIVRINSVQIDYHKSQNWKQLLITDEIKYKAYTIFTAGSHYSLSEINLKDGSLTEICVIKNLFPQKIRVNNGYLYFLYKDLNNIFGRRKLYQLDLSRM